MKLLFLIAVFLCAARAEAKTKHEVEIEGERFTVIVRGNEARARLSGFHLDPIIDWRRARLAIERATGCAVIETDPRRNMSGDIHSVDALLDCSDAASHGNRGNDR